MLGLLSKEDGASILDVLREKCSILISSCDSYSDLWLPFCKTLERHWPDRGMDTFILSETKTAEIKHVQFINSGVVKNDWSRNLEHALQSVQTKYVCLMLEDFFLRSDVDQSVFQDVIKFADSHDADMVRLLKKPTLHEQAFMQNNIALKISMHAPYRVSCQASLWRRTSLIQLVKAGESAWEFERYGSERSVELGFEHYTCKATVLPYFHHVVERGRWFPWDASHFGRQNIGCDFASRNVMSWSYGFFWLVRKSVLNLKRRMKLLKIRLLHGV